jgi:hypothetical protein
VALAAELVEVLRDLFTSSKSQITVMPPFSLRLRPKGVPF